MYEYSITDDTLIGAVDLEQLMKELSSYEIEKVSLKNGTIYVSTNQQKTDIDNAIASHAPSPVPQYELVVKGAIDFFNEQLIKFSAENITQGITVYNKTREVADYLQDIMRYGQSGSLYEVVNEVDSLIAEGLPLELSPFVTEERLLNLKNEVLGYLS